jgi:ABC-type lipoprotein release transport system permease subunit
MNPLSPFAYYRRHKRSALLLVTVISVVTLGITVMVGLLDSLTENLDILGGQLTRFSLVHPSIGDSLDPAAVSRIRVHPSVAHVVPVQRLFINMPLGPATGSWSLLGVSEADVPLLMELCDVRLKEGRSLRPRTNEIVLSEEIARALELRIGDQIGRSINESYYGGIPAELVLVGILESIPALGTRGPSAGPAPSIRAGFASREYIESHEQLSRPAGLIVVPREGGKAAVDDFLETTILSGTTDVETAARMFMMTERVRRLFRLVSAVIDGLVAVVIALVVGVMNQIALTQRLPDLGVLHALGHQRRLLVRRLALETAVVAGSGWVIGLALSWCSLAWVKTNLYQPNGMELRLANLTLACFSVPVPLVVITSAALSIARIFARLDPVAVIERGKLSTEQGRRPGIRAGTPNSSTRPLSSWTFYRRHRRRAVMLVGAVALMILGISFPMFLTSAMIDTQNPFYLNYLRHVSEVRPGVERTVDAETIGQIGAHPAVERVIPATQLDLTISIPPVGISKARIYGVSRQDLPILLDKFGMQLTEGRLPQPYSNEIVLSEALAANRALRVGDAVGRPVYEEDEDIPTEMLIVGILASPDISLGFASLEYLESHALYSSWAVSLLVVPVDGQKPELDSWLESYVASEGTGVSTYAASLREARQSTLAMHLLFAALEAVIALVAAAALTALNHIFFAQRQEEFGILHAVGRSRPWLTLRAAKESGSVVAVGWLIGAALCMAGLVCAQAGMYGPRGLSLDLANPAPWLFTAPIPLAVVAASAGTISRLLSRLDPVAVIERR